MMRYGCIFALIIWSTLGNPAFANGKNEEVKRSKFSLELITDYYNVPGRFFEFGGVDKHPSNLEGYWLGIKGSFTFCKNDSCSLGLELFTAHATGQGPWTRKSDLEKYHVTGEAVGNMDWRFSGGILEFEKRFVIWESVSPYIELGVGVGALQTNFDGFFNGTYVPTNTPLRGIPANEKDLHILPIVNLGVGARITLPHSFFVGPGMRLGTPGFTGGIMLEKRW